MIIYKQELKDGIADKVKANASIAYASKIAALSKTPKLDIKPSEVPQLAKSSKDDWDLFPFASVLVSVGWNGNDDVFDPGEAWAGRYSPVNKQLNFMHNEKVIVGHMTDALVMDESGNIIEDEPECIPDFYHIVTANVLYRHWTDEQMQELVDKIIAGIPENEWFVSMECLFRNFDYALISPNKEQQIVARSESTSFLTKHLRAYGGSGVYEGYRIGRLIRNMTFSGNAIVDNPANPHSIIFNDINPFKSTAKTISFPKQEKNNMAETNDVLISQLRDELAKANARHEKLEEKLAQQVAEAQKTEKDRVEKQIAGLQVDVENLQKKVEAKDKAIAEKETELEALQKEHKQVQAELEDMKKKADKAEKNKAKAERLSKLVAAHVPAAQAESLVEKFNNLNDEQFEAIVEVQAELYKDKAEEKKDEKKEEKKEDKSKASTEDAETKALEDAKAETGFVPGDTEDKGEELATAALAWFDNIRSNKNSK